MLKKLSLLLSAVLLVSVFFGCSGVAPKDIVWRDSAVDLAWPPPPAIERIRFLRSITGPADFKKNTTQQKSWRWLLGEEQNEIPLLTPLAVAADDAGAVWVADSGSHLLYKVDLSREKVDYVQELDGVRLVLPAGVAVDNQRGRVFLSDAALGQIFVLDRESTALLFKLSLPDGFKRPAGLAIDDEGRLFVADVLGGCVVVFDAAGNFLKRIFSKAEGREKFDRPVDVALGPSGELLILSAASFQLEIQSRDGALIRIIGQVGDAPGNFARPKGVAVDSLGHIFVTDAAFDNVQVFDMTGNLLTHLGKAGNQPGHFNLPAGLYVDRGERLFVADSYNHRVQVFQIAR